MPAFFRKLSFRKKILSSYILFISISCLLIAVYFIRNMEAAREESYSYMYRFGEQVSMSTDVIVSNMDRIRFLHFIDDDIRQMLRKSVEDKTTEEMLDETEYIRQALNHMTNMNQYVLRATVINEYGEIYSNVDTNDNAYLERLAEIDKKQDWGDKNKIYYTDVYEEEIYLIRHKLVTSISKIYDIDQEDYIGTVYIDLNFSSIQQMMEQLSASGTTGTNMMIFGEGGGLLYDSRGQREETRNPVSQKEQEEIREFLENDSEKKELIIFGEKCLAAGIQNQTTNWKILTWMPLSEIYASGWKSMVGIFSAMLLLLAAAVLIGIYLADQISCPVTVLAKAMGKVEQGKVDLLEEDKYSWQDEMGLLLKSYNEMGERINDSIEKIYIYQINQKQTELKMLQFQINPHFLYNTLNTISSIAALSDMEEIVKIADNLSSMFQYNIKGEDIVPVQKEIRHVKNYLEIQAIRFPGKYRFTYRIAPEIQGQRMLKFLLQPLAENSMHHAFGRMKEMNEICLTAELCGEDMIFLLRDNGIGMDRERVRKLNRELADTDTGTLVNHVDRGIGLRNVNARIKNLYGKGYGIQICSEEGCYTEIQIRIRSLEEEGGL